MNEKYLSACLVTETCIRWDSVLHQLRYFVRQCCCSPLIKPCNALRPLLWPPLNPPWLLSLLNRQFPGWLSYERLSDSFLPPYVVVEWVEDVERWPFHGKWELLHIRG